MDEQKKPQCEGWRRSGGAFTLGPVQWKRCENDAIVNLTVEQDGKIQTIPACMQCWGEGLERGIDVKSATPIE